MRELGLDTRNPAVLSGADLLSALFNLPADRAIKKWNNLVLAADSETELWQSVALALGYSEWDVKLGPTQKEPKLKSNSLGKLKSKGKLKKIAQAHLTLGQAHYELQNFEEAKKQFRMAARDKDKKIKKTANSWIKYTENEQSRAKNLELRRNYIKQS